MEIKISILVMIKVDLIQKKLINHLVDYVRNSLIPANLLKSIINLWVMLRVLKIIRPKKKPGSVSPNQKK